MVTPDEQARFFIELDAHRAILSKVARSFCRTSADREDLIQEIIVQLWRSFPRFDGRSKFSTWVDKVAPNVANSYQRREVVRHRYVIQHRAAARRARLPTTVLPFSEGRAVNDLARNHTGALGGGSVNRGTHGSSNASEQLGKQHEAKHD